MCGRFTLTVSPTSLQELLPGLQIQDWPGPRYNIAPSQAIPTVLNDGEHQLSWVGWGLIPRWAKDAAIGHKLINARAETLAEKPSFRDPLRRQRCLILADGFYEWRAVGRRKRPMYIRLRSGTPFAFAGLWDRWRSPEGDWVTTATIITTQPNSLIRSIHSRMPVILSPEHYALWLSPAEQSASDLDVCLQPYDSDAMEAYPVSTRMNRPEVDDPECIQCWTEPET